MANHKSAMKRIRSDRTKRIRNSYQHKTTRNAIRNLRANTNKTEAEKMLPEVISMIDVIAKNHIIHKKKAANLKSSLTRHVNAL